MKGVSLTGVDSAGGLISPQPGRSTTFKVDGSPIALVGDLVASHGQAPHAAATIAAGSSWMTINGVPVCVEDSTASCGHTATGSSWFKISP